MKLPGFIEEIRGEGFRWRLVWGVRSGYLLTAWFAGFAILSDIMGVLPTRLLYWLIPLKLITNSLMWAGLQARRFVALGTSINSIADVFIFTVVIYFTGGPLSLFIPIYFIEISILAMLANFGITILMSIVTIIFYGTMAILIYGGILPAQPSFIEHFLHKSGLTLGFVFLNIASLALVLGILTFSASSILRFLSGKERELGVKTQELMEAGRHKSQFMANITHELRTPIHGILGLVALIEDGIYGPITGKQKEALTGINQSSQNLLQLIDDLLDLARAEAGRMEIKPSQLRVDEVLNGVVSTARWLLGRKKLGINMEVPQDLPDLISDRGKLVQILINLISNSIKFTPEGGRITVMARKHNDTHIDISVEDTGIGISEKDIPSIFEEFRQVDGSYSREYGGTGLGLYLVKKITEQLHGQVLVKSTPGQGSVFTVRLPVKFNS